MDVKEERTTRRSRKSGGAFVWLATMCLCRTMQTASSNLRLHPRRMAMHAVSDLNDGWIDRWRPGPSEDVTHS